MPAPKPRPTAADYLVIALSPALIMGLVGSLVFFLLEIAYAGQYEGRLQWILFWFVFAIVLVARISMATEIAARAPLYGIVLAVAVWLGMGQFVEYSPELLGLSWLINGGLIGLVWWSAYRLVWDCTYIDEKAEATGTGVLQAAGLEGGESTASENQEDPADKTADRPESEEPSPQTWWQRYQKYREKNRKKHTPGVWIVYFSLAALPIFGLGQLLIPSGDLARRRYVFWLMGVYAACALGLLVTTAFLGLRRYLRQRQLQMPPAITSSWLATGAGLIVLLLVIGALLPRPDTDYSFLGFTPAGSKGREASRYAMKGGDTGKGEGRGGPQEKDQRQGDPVAGKQGNGNKSDSKDKTSGSSSSKDSGKQAGKGEESKSQPGDTSRTPDKKGDTSRKGEPGKGEAKTGEKQSETQDSKQERTDKSSSPSRSWSAPLSFLSRVAPVLKWIVLGVLAVVVVVILLRNGLRFLANFFDWARKLLEAWCNFWQGLFGRRQDGQEAEGEEAPAARVPQPFHNYANPFRTGQAEHLSPAGLTRYSFEALEAWAWERDLARGREETPLEFAHRLGEEVPALEAEAKRLGALYARVLYDRGRVPGSWRQVLEQFWDKLALAAEQPLSA
jgi:hypothetical protein